MTPTIPKKAEKPSNAVAIKIGKPRNYNLGNGVYRFSKTRMYHKKAIYRFIGKKFAPTKKWARPPTVMKPIGGDKNGEMRIVLLRKRRSYYATQDKIKKRPSKKLFKHHPRKLRSSLTPGTILILLAGRHKGKRVVFLKQLHSGLLLITGPFLINACPIRRIHQQYVIGTQTKLDLNGLKLTDYIDDEYFRRERKKRAKKNEGDIFAIERERYKVNYYEKAVQKQIDTEVIAAIKKDPNHKLLFAYLATMFGLRSSQYPHRMNF